MVKRVIIDLDAGADDAFALMFLLYEHKQSSIKIEAITCCQGNTCVDNVVVNVFRVLEATKQAEIPVYKGPFDSILTQDPKQRYPKVTRFHGYDGFGDLDYEKQPNVNRLQSENAIIAMNRIVSNNPNEISLICIGPLTNVALALKVFPDFKHQVKDLHIMGGNYTGVGNITSSAEFNFHCDPEAACITLECIKCQITLLPIECARLGAIPMQWRFEVLGKIENEFMKLMNRIDGKIWANHKDKGWIPYDAYLIALFLYADEIIAKKSVHNVSVELAGYKTRGQAVLDHTKNKPPNAVIIEQINVDNFRRLLLHAAQCV